jgi:tetratricopeptide (TPR) repeat protein
MVAVVDTERDARNKELVNNLREVEEMVTLREYEKAEARLKELLNSYTGEPRIFFALGRTAGQSATVAFDDAVRDERLKKAEVFYKSAILAASGGSYPALLSNAHVALGRIYEFYDRNDEALKEFEAAIAIGEVKEGAYTEAKAGKARLTQK